jgi:hypothetical protein
MLHLMTMPIEDSAGHDAREYLRFRRGEEFHLFPGGVGSWLQMQTTNSAWNGEVGGGSSPLQLDDDVEIVELRHTDGCIQFY